MRRRIPDPTQTGRRAGHPDRRAAARVGARGGRRAPRAPSETEAQTELATASIGPGGLITTLQNERNYGSVWLLGFEATLQLPVTSFDEATAATDDAIATFRDDLDSKSAARCAETYAPALDDARGGARRLRELVDHVHRPARTSNTSRPPTRSSSATPMLIDELFDGQRPGGARDRRPDAPARASSSPTWRPTRSSTWRRLIRVAAARRGDRGPARHAAGDRRGRRPPRPVSRTTSTRSTSWAPAATRPPARQGSTRSSPPSGSSTLAHQAIDTGQVRVCRRRWSSLGAREDDEGWNGFRTAVNDEITDRADELNADAARDASCRYLAAGRPGPGVVAVRRHLAGVAVDHPAAAVAHRPGQGDGRASACPRR